MPTPDDATEVYMQQLLADAPPLPADLAALVVRTFGKTPEASSPASNAA